MWHIVSDSSFDLFQLLDSDKDISFSVVPFSIHIGDYAERHGLIVAY